MIVIPEDTQSKRPAMSGAIFALLAALLFGASTPLVQRFGATLGHG